MKYAIMFIVGILMISSVSAEYLTYKDDEYYCSDRVNGEKFMADCPMDYRVPGDWFEYYHFTQNVTEAYCQDGKLIATNCTYVKLPWNHPLVSGGSSFSQEEQVFQPQQDVQVPEFSTITAACALVGAGYFAYKKRDKTRK